ncbi:unnamed protein product [Brachionus calyciflorus]|uniref:B box-type domain-containing protein n=1 Tax=Brachionus calyciflorus TaxID=104777 RepID=A0A813M4C3_9BILA|nr:unnamed protein product [Brachionus calyciflorus]
MGDSKGLISAMTRKWKLEQIPSKKLEIENKLMEDRLNQLKTELNFEKNKRNAMGGTIWSKAQPGPVTNYAKNVVNRNDSGDSLLNKLTNRQIKLQVLKDDYLQKQTEKINSISSKEKKQKCGQCEKNLAFTRCLECGEDYCANCFTSFHMKGALQKHRAISLASGSNNSFSRQLSNSRPQSSDTRNEDNESIYDITSNRSNPTSAKKKVEFSLFDGEYDERQAHESFQQALNEWRNGSKNSDKIIRENSQIKKPSSSRDAGVGTTQQIISNQIQDLEKQISSHSLSYAERMLLQKYRRNDLEITYTPRNEIQEELPTPQQSIDTSQTHLNFDSIIQALQGGKQNNFDENESSNSFNFIQAPIDLKPVNKLNFEDLNRNSLVFEEVETSSKIKSLNLNLNLEPEIIEVKNSIKSVDIERPKSVKSTHRINSARVKSARNSIQFEKNLNREPTNLLKSIAQREIEKFDDIQMGEFFMLGVNSEQTLTKETPRVMTAKSRPQSSRIDPKLYAMSPRSWNPQKSLAENLSLSISEDKNLKQKKSDSPLVKSDLGEINTKEKNQIEMNFKPKTASKNPINVSSSVNFESKKLPTSKMNKKMDFDRAKSFVGPKISTKSPAKFKRPISASYNFDRPVSRMNYEFAENFSEYDIDDGRSSRIFQNEDDNNYFGQLVNEYQSSIITKITDMNDVKYSQSSSKDLTDSLNKSLSNLELTIRNDEYNNDDDDDDLESLTLEELKSLK